VIVAALLVILVRADERTFLRSELWGAR
jgi:hypothetical protein